MARSVAQRPRVSRETRLLFITITVAILALWMLGRMRFPEHAPTNPVPAVLAPLTMSAPFEDLAGTIARVGETLAPLMASAVVADAERASAGAGEMAFLRMSDDLGVGVLAQPVVTPPVSVASPAGLIAFDRSTGLVLVRLPEPRATALTPWAAQRLDAPRYLIVSDGAGARPTWHPVFVARLSPEQSVRWQGVIWRVPLVASFAPGAFVFTMTGEWVGTTARHRGETAIVPADLVAARAVELLRHGTRRLATLGIDVSALTAALATATHATRGVVVAHVDPEGPAASVVNAADVIESVGANAISDLDDWDAVTGRLVPGEAVGVRLLRGGTSHDVTLLPQAPAAPARGDLGAELRAVAGVGVHVVAVDRGSPAEHADLRPGDVITSFDGVVAPSPRQVARQWARAPAETALVVILKRAGRYHAIALER